MKHYTLAIGFFLCLIAPCIPAGAAEITIKGTRFLLDGKPFPYTQVSFFNAIFNPSFNKSSEERTQWMKKFQRYGINVLRIWGQWDHGRYKVDTTPEATLYYSEGRLREKQLATLKAILADADKLGMVVELALFSYESWEAKKRLDPEAADRAVAALTNELKPYRNVTFQVWNEHSERVLDHVKTIKANDPRRLVTNSPGFAGVLGDDDQNRALDYLSPHTSRRGKHWEIAPGEIAWLLKKYNKPVLDDEPARCGTPNFGGPKGQTYPSDHIVQIDCVWRAGGYVCYHHDMFQTAYGTPPIPPSGIPDPEYNPYHKAVFEFLALRERYAPKMD